MNIFLQLIFTGSYSSCPKSDFLSVIFIARHLRHVHRPIAIYLVIAALWLSATALSNHAAVKVEDVPTFQLRARIVSSGSNVQPQAVYSFAFGGPSVAATGEQWSAWLAFDKAAAERFSGPQSYPNSYMRDFPFVTALAVSGLANPAILEAELRFDGSDTIKNLNAELFAGSLGIMIWLDDAKTPQAATMAEYNRRYWTAFGTVTIADSERPHHFPIVDRLISCDSDSLVFREGISNLTLAGFSAIMLPPDKLQRDALLSTGLRRTAWAVYCPPGYAFDYDPSITASSITAWAQEQASPYLSAGYERTDMAAFAMADEPGWYYPSMYAVLTNNPAGLARFREYLRAQKFKPRDVGARRWEDVLPLGRGGARDLPSKRLFYWTQRFFAWDSARHFAVCTRALESAFYTNMPILVNWNFFSGRFYVPGPVANNAAKNDPDAAMGGHDWLEFGRMRGCTMLWTEDWFGDDMAYQWSYYCARLRCAAEAGGVEFGGYVIPRTAGSRTNGILQKVLTIVGSGGKAIKYFVFGPEYTFPGNCYSENLRVLPVMAEAHRIIGAAEEVLWPGRRPRTAVALLMPRSAQLWDAKDQTIAAGIDDCTHVDLNRHTVDYMAEVYDLYLALQHANIPADILDEDNLTPEQLKPYRVLYVTEPNIPEEGQKGLLKWVKQGGTLVTVSGAGAADRYDEPCRVLARGVGMEEQPRTRLIIADVNTLPAVGTIRHKDGDITAIGVRGKVNAARADSVQAVFDDGTPAILERPVGKGHVVHFAWMPGLSYVRTASGTQDGLPAGWSDILRRWIVSPITLAGVKAPVSVDRALIETPILVSDKGAAITMLNWSGETIQVLNVTARVAFSVKKVRSVYQGERPFQQDGEEVRFAMPLGSADIVTLTP